MFEIQEFSWNYRKTRLGWSSFITPLILRFMENVNYWEKRKYRMSRILAKDTKPEMAVRKFLHSQGFRYRLHDKKLSGKPDIVLPKYKTVIFIHGCFWHSHKGCKLNRIPKKNHEYWIPKLSGNVYRDKKNLNRLKKNGWTTIIIWECKLTSKNVNLHLTNLAIKLYKAMPS